MTKGIIRDNQKQFSQKEKVHKKSLREKDKEHKQQLEDNEKKYNKSLSEKNKEQTPTSTWWEWKEIQWVIEREE